MIARYNTIQQQQQTKIESIIIQIQIYIENAKKKFVFKLYPIYFGQGKIFPFSGLNISHTTITCNLLWIMKIDFLSIRLPVFYFHNQEIFILANNHHHHHRRHQHGFSE